MVVKRGSHGSERGAALFIVVLVVSLLTAIGAFAVHATSLAQLGSGYSRRSAVVFYLAELAMNVQMARISEDGNQHVVAGSKATQTCSSQAPLDALLAAGTTTRFCTVMNGDVAKQEGVRANSSLAADPEGYFGALSRPDLPADQTLDANILVEVTDHGPAPEAFAGTAVNGTSTQSTLIWQDTITSTGRVLPQNICDPDNARASQTQSLRGLIVYSTTGTQF